MSQSHPPVADWGVIDEKKLEKDKVTLANRVHDVLMNINSDVLVSSVQFIGKLKLLDKTVNPDTEQATKERPPLEEEIQDLIKRKSDIIEKAAHGDASKLEKLKNEFRILEENLALKCTVLKELNHFSSALLQSIEKFTADLKQVYAAPDSQEKRKQYDESYNQVIDLLVQIEAFYRDEKLNKVDGGVALWSKLHQFFAGKLAKESGKLTLEGSFAGYLFDNLSWGTSWSHDPDTPLKQFWMRMSREIADTATGKDVHLYVLEHVVTISAFFTDEWPKIRESIAQKKIGALMLYKYQIEEKAGREIYLLETADVKGAELKKEKYDNCYIFSKKPPQLYFKDGSEIQTLEIMADDMKKFEKLVEKAVPGVEPIAKESASGTNPSVVEVNPLWKLARDIISANPGHSRFTSLKPPKEAIAITTDEELAQHIKPVDADYRNRQQTWHSTQAKISKWKPALLEVARKLIINEELEKARVIAENLNVKSTHATDTTNKESTAYILKHISQSPASQMNKAAGPISNAGDALLMDLNIAPNSAEYELLKETAKGLATEAAALKPTKANLYDQLLETELAQMQNKIATEQMHNKDSTKLDVNKITQDIPLYLEKIADYMKKNNINEVSKEGLVNIFGKQAKIVEDVLKHSTLLETNQNGSQKFKTNSLIDYFHANLVFKELMEQPAVVETSSLPRPK